VLLETLTSTRTDVAGTDSSIISKTPVLADAKTKAEATRSALLTASILPTLLRLAVPTLLVLVAQTAVNIAEAYYVGILGTDALAGAALVFPIYMLMVMMSNAGFGSGVASSVARAIGSGRSADDVLFHAMVLAILIGALFTLGSITGGASLYRMLGARGDALTAAVNYSDYLFAGAIPVWIVNLQAAALRGSGNVRVPAMVTLIGAIVTIPLSPLLIFGLGPIPGLGIGGAGLALGLYYTTAMVFLLHYMRAGRGGLTFRVLPLSARLFADILKVGLPTALNAAVTNLSVIFVTGAVGTLGTTAIAGYGLAARLDYIMGPLLFGVGTATLTMVGINVGAGQITRARRIAWTSGIVGLLLAGATGLLISVFPAIWLRFFSGDATVVYDGATYLHIVAPAYGALGFGYVAQFAAQGAGRAMWPLVASGVRILIAAGGAWLAIGPLGLGMTGLAGMVAASLVAYAAVCALVLGSSALWRKEGR